MQVTRKQWEQQQHFGGGGSVATPAVPNPTPPPTANNAASLAVEQAQYRQQLRRKNIASTIYAGATGGYQPASTAGQTGAGQQGAAPSVGGSGGTKTG